MRANYQRRPGSTSCGCARIWATSEPFESVLATSTNIFQAIAILAERGKRFESGAFRLGYDIFRIVHCISTGILVRFGNFRLLPYDLMEALVHMPELRNHYAGAVTGSRARCDRVPMDRGIRLRGHSITNLTALVTHGISGIATFAETVAPES